MVENLHLVLVAVVAIFVLFIVGLAYGAWMTRDIELTPPKR